MQISKSVLSIMISLGLCAAMLLFGMKVESKSAFADDNAGTILGTYGQSTYTYYDLPDSVQTYAQAESFCESKGGHLAVITSQAENDFVFSAMSKDGFTDAYIGLYKNGDGDWVWVNGEPVSWTNWHEDEPNGEGGDEFFAMFYWKYDNGAWNDGDFDEGHGTVDGGQSFICETTSDDFIMGQDNYSFLNSADDFGYPNPYYYPRSQYDSVLPAAEAKYYWAKQKAWGGNCFGMSTTAAMFKWGGLQQDDFTFYPETVDTTYSFPKPATLDVEDRREIINLIEPYQLSQNTDECKCLLNNNTGKYKDLVDCLLSGKPAIICVWWKPCQIDGNGNLLPNRIRDGYDGHALLAYGITEISQSKYKINVYNCDDNSDNDYIAIDTSDNSIDWKYSYNSGGEVKGTPTTVDKDLGDDVFPGFLSYVSINDFEGIVKDAFQSAKTKVDNSLVPSIDASESEAVVEARRNAENSMNIAVPTGSSISDSAGKDIANVNGAFQNLPCDDTPVKTTDALWVAPNSVYSVTDANSTPAAPISFFDKGSSYSISGTTSAVKVEGKTGNGGYARIMAKSTLATAATITYTANSTASNPLVVSSKLANLTIAPVSSGSPTVKISGSGSVDIQNSESGPKTLELTPGESAEVDKDLKVTLIKETAKSASKSDFKYNTSGTYSGRRQSTAVKSKVSGMGKITTYYKENGSKNYTTTAPFKADRYGVYVKTAVGSKYAARTSYLYLGTYTIVPHKIGVLKLKAGNNKLKVSWSNYITSANCVSYYRVCYKQVGRGWKYKTYKAKSTHKVTLKLKNKKKYSVKVRVYRNVSGPDAASAYSAIKSARTK
ncbi:MAG: C-type lectin domain-containing protein [Coriobacteriales bacterium]|nr:C-type lectin domain-containing protein [Coriobacteriales bacterium]